MTKNNVYGSISSFFEENAQLDILINQEDIEGFLRQKAWQGKTDKDLKDIFDKLQMFLSYVFYTNISNLEELSASEYSLAIEWMEVQFEFEANFTSVNDFFIILKDFYDYLIKKKVIVNKLELEKASALMTIGKQLNFIEPSLQYFYNTYLNDDEDIKRLPDKKISVLPNIVSEDISEQIKEIVERLMLKFSSYFQKQEFEDDIDRAITLYTGPVNEIPEDTPELPDGNFWIGFWDYFLFDYHLLENDLTPLEHFKNNFNNLSRDEKVFLEDIATAKFTVFHVEKIIDNDWLECINLLTEETFKIPNPDFDYTFIKKALFFGHIFFKQCGKEIIMINFITSIDVSSKLKVRIKEEIEKQKTIFQIQEPNASWDDFLQRHSNLVRHTIDLLSTYAKVNVTPHIYENKSSNSKRTKQLKESPLYLDINRFIGEYLPKIACSKHDIKLTQKLWKDYYLSDEKKLQETTNPFSVTAALIFTYLQINTDDETTKNSLLAILEQEINIKREVIVQISNKIQKKMKIKQFDPRYLNEEGFLYMLYQ
ncbi:hypothetical protein LJC10_01350 [Selenomonadales bacterium OttesenSCG-928-I06]|nr:hypothetical protein [Selenomonadales bacterium OttesenSCG-928-I06]